jgi:hypothetical protein
MITIQYYQIFTKSNKNGVEEPVACALTKERARKLLEDANAGHYNRVWRTAKPPYYAREMELDFIPEHSGAFLDG